MYSESVKKRAQSAQDRPPGGETEDYMNMSSARPTLGRRKQRDIDVLGQQVEQEPRTPTRPRRNPGTQTDAEIEVEIDTEGRITSENEAIVINQLENLRRELKRYSDHYVWNPKTEELVYEVVKKILPELVTETTELRNAVKDLTKAVDTLVKRQEGDPMQKGLNRSHPTEVQGVKTVIATGPTYRPTKSSNPNMTQTTI
ncbi:hypothetical protein H2248_012618 [Termitomyces sp. 'cryptogamus']|nr:hypothetical protein H2248_012618 [Termitomyces sp. 'cryptogamus']